MNEEIVLAFAGDVVCKREEGVKISQELKEKLDEAEVFSVNLEAPLEGVGQPIKKAGPNLNQNNSVVDSLKNIGVNVVACANNHICDYGKLALEYTLDKLKDFVTVGASTDFDKAYQLKIINVNGGVILGFLAFAENGYGAFCEENDEFGFAWVNNEKVDDIVADAKTKCNVLIVQVHAGVEEINVPLPEWRKKYKKIVDLGAAAVVAHHPHVPQGWEFYNGAPIFYSLGNFFFDMDSKHPLWNKGIIAKLTVKTTDFQQISVDVLPIEKHDDTVTLSTDQNYLTHLNHLCEILQEPIYSKMVEQELDELWNNRYKSYYLSALNGVEKINIIKLLKFVKRLFMKETIRLELFHHLLFIESHLFAVNAALKQYYKKRN